MLAQGETVRLNAQQSVSLRVGDAGAVFVSVNNGKAAPLGRDGQVVTRQFVVESTDRQAAASAAPTPPTSPRLASRRSEPRAFVIADRGGAQTSTASERTACAPNPVPLVQPVAATPSRHLSRDAKSAARAGTSSARPS
jgi:hypothetical protein